jgi:hypothetical protein
MICDVMRRVFMANPLGPRHECLWFIPDRAAGGSRLAPGEPTFQTRAFNTTLLYLEDVRGWWHPTIGVHFSRVCRIVSVCIGVPAPCSRDALPSTLTGPLGRVSKDATSKASLSAAAIAIPAEELVAREGATNYDSAFHSEY